MANITILEVAAAAHVSKTTVSDILRSCPGRSYTEETIRHVHRTAERLGYRPHSAARLLRQKATNIIGLAVSVRQRPHLNNIVVAVHDECLKRGYQPAIFEPYHLLPNYEHTLFPGLDTLTGLFSIDLSMDNNLPDFYAKLSEKLPIVALYPTESPDIHSVSANWTQGVEMAVEHLVRLGHHRIAYAHDPSLTYAIDRMRAHSWQECIKRFGLSDAERCTVTYKVPEHLATMGERMINAPQPIAVFVEQIVERLQSMGDAPTALICTSDELALALSGRLNALGWKLPRDLSIVGFYGIDFGEYSYPPLTTVAQPLQEIANTALDHLTDWIRLREDKQPAPVKQALLSPQLIVRQSCAPPRKRKPAKHTHK